MKLFNLYENIPKPKYLNQNLFYSISCIFLLLKNIFTVKLTDFQTNRCYT